MLFDEIVKALPKNGNYWSAALRGGGSGGQVQLSISTADGEERIAAEIRTKQRSRRSPPCKCALQDEGAVPSADSSENNRCFICADGRMA